MSARPLVATERDDRDLATTTKPIGGHSERAGFLYSSAMASASMRREAGFRPAHTMDQSNRRRRAASQRSTSIPRCQS